MFSVNKHFLINDTFIFIIKPDSQEINPSSENTTELLIKPFIRVIWCQQDNLSDKQEDSKMEMAWEWHGTPYIQRQKERSGKFATSTNDNSLNSEINPFT